MAYSPSTEELRLIEGCLANNRLAQKALYDKYKKAMYTLAYRMTGSFYDADEILQEAFLRIFRGLKSFQGKSTLGAWIKTIVVRVSLKKLKSRIVFEPIETYPEQRIIWTPDIDLDYLEQAIQALPDGYRSVFVLIEIEGYKHREVATMLGISEGTSKSQLYYAKRQLQKQLRDVCNIKNV